MWSSSVDIPFFSLEWPGLSKILCFNSWFMRTILSDHHAVEQLLPEGLEECLEAVFWLSSPFLCPLAVWSWPVYVFSLLICSPILDFRLSFLLHFPF